MYPFIFEFENQSKDLIFRGNSITVRLSHIVCFSHICLFIYLREILGYGDSHS